MRSADKAFYNSKAWKTCRQAYLHLHPLCEECLKRGEYTPACHVHHKIFLTKQNQYDPKIALNFDNLEALCQECHNRIHAGTIEYAKRYTIDHEGNVILK